MPHAFLDETIRFQREYIHGMKAELTLNFDEVCMSECEDWKPKKVIAPKTIAGDGPSSCLATCETHIDSRVYHGCWGVLDAVHCDIARLGACSQEANASRCSDGCRSRVETMIKTVSGLESFP
jgi:hypothetical protein